jgi:hypothetical protein
MDKARVIKLFELDEPTYQDICSILGLDNPGILSGSQLYDFDKIHDWLKNNEVKSFSEAKERYQSEARTASTAKNGRGTTKVKFDSFVSETLEDKAEASLENGLILLEQADRQIQQALLKPYLEAVYKQAQSPEFQEKYRKACEGEKVADGDFFTQLMRKLLGRPKGTLAFPVWLRSFCISNS